jgi:hypothetical protein
MGSLLMPVVILYISKAKTLRYALTGSFPGLYIIKQSLDSEEHKYFGVRIPYCITSVFEKSSIMHDGYADYLEEVQGKHWYKRHGVFQKE